MDRLIRFVIYSSILYGWILNILRFVGDEYHTTVLNVFSLIGFIVPPIGAIVGVFF